MRTLVVFGLLIAAGCGAAPTAPAAAPGEVSFGPATEEHADKTVDRLVAQDFAGAREWFAPDVAEQLDAAKLGSAWRQITGTLGPFKSKALLGRQTKDGNQIYEYDVAFENGHAITALVMDSHEKLGGIFFRPKQP